MLRHIPSGRVVTYGDVARLAGRPRAARAVGRVLRTAPELHLPCHRVIAAGGWLGGFGHSPDLKAALLAAEGHAIRRGRIVDFEKKRWGERSSSRPPERSGK